MYMIVCPKCQFRMTASHNICRTCGHAMIRPTKEEVEDQSEPLTEQKGFLQLLLRSVTANKKKPQEKPAITHS